METLRVRDTIARNLWDQTWYVSGMNARPDGLVMACGYLAAGKSELGTMGSTRATRVVAPF